MQKILGRVGTWCKYKSLKQVQLQTYCRQQTPCCLHTTGAVRGQKKKQNTWYSEMIVPWHTKAQLVDELERSILYEDKNILALNKPNGLPMHALKYSERLPLDIAPPASAELSVVSSLPELAERLGTPELKPIYSLNRLYSGVVLLTKNESAANTLQKYFKHTRAQKVYYQHFWALTVGVPRDNTQICEIGLKQQIVNDWRLSVLEPNVTKRNRESGKVVKFSVEHLIVDSSRKYECALVCLRPTATKWDFIELYLTQQMCAALGDHVYSPRVRTVMGKPVLMNPQSSYPAPQILPDYLLKPLGLGRTNTADIPSHVHCYQVDIPVVRNRKSTLTSIKAPLPDFFKKTLSLLDLTCPLEKRNEGSHDNGDAIEKAKI